MKFLIKYVLVTVCTIIVVSGGMIMNTDTGNEISTFKNNFNIFSDIQTAGNEIKLDTINANIATLNTNMQDLDTNITAYLKANISSPKASVGSSVSGGGNSSVKYKNVIGYDKDGNMILDTGAVVNSNGFVIYYTTYTNNFENIVAQATAQTKGFMIYGADDMGWYTNSFTVGEYSDEEIINDLVGSLQVEHDFYGNQYFRIEYIGEQNFHGSRKNVFKCYRG